MSKTPNETTVLKPVKPASSLSRRHILRSGVALAASSSLKGWGYPLLSGANGEAPSGQYSQLMPAGAMSVASLVVTNVAAGLLPPPFGGLSYEKGPLQQSFFTPTNQTLITLFTGLGASVLRLGGGSVDQYVWTPNGVGRTNLQIAPSDVASLAAFVKATGWQCIYGVNLGGAATGATTPALAAAEGAYAVSQFGSSLRGISIG